ncbi:MAG: anthranilate synthase component II [Pseudobdellovibrionaceae bacterium]
MILLIDNYDSFTYNVFHLIEDLDYPCQVVRNDKITLAEIKKLSPKAIVLSPGPGHPADSKICLDILKNLSKKIPTLGICLGHQAVGLAFGATIEHSPQQMHGKKSVIQHKGQGIFKGLPKKFSVMRYHSLSVSSQKLPKALQVTATTDDGVIMGLKHRQYPIQGLQFHPESFASEQGLALMQNFLKGLKS